jgi:hypothetical protein
MPQVDDFSAMAVGETVSGWCDFSNWLDPSEVLTSAAVSTTNYVPGAGAPIVTTVAAPSIGAVPVALGGSGRANASVIQQWRGARVGTARVTFTVKTGAGQTLIAWGHQRVAAAR